jgi:hypothetical protein
MAQDTYNTYAPLQTVVLSTNTGIVQFGNNHAGTESDWIPQHYIDLIIVIQGAAVSGSGTPGLAYRFNADSGANYGYSIVEAYNSGTPTSYRGNGTTSLAVGWNGRYASGNNATTKIQISNYSNSTTHKNIITEQAGGTLGPSFTIGRWASTSPIKTIQFALGSTFPDDTWAIGSTFTLYGVGVRNRS